MNKLASLLDKVQPNTFWQFVKSSTNRRNLICLPTLPLSTSKLPLTQCPMIPCGKFFKFVAFHRNFLFLCVNCTQTPEARCASLLRCQKSSQIGTGVEQGCVIAPDLFNCVIDHPMRRLLRRCSLGIQLGEYQLTDLDYADDIAIFAPSACVLQEALTIVQEEANLVGMQIRWPKTKLMSILPNPTNNLPLNLCIKEVLFVDSFTYLESLITSDSSSSRDITSRIAKAASAMCRLSNPFFRKHRISIRTKINMYRALVVFVLLYGSEALATTFADRRRLDVFDMRCQRRLLRVFWQQHVSNQSIRERTKQPTASSLLRWF